jgi:hypothetical protein
VAELDISELSAGEYCFVFNTELANPDNGVRLVQWFYIVDDYVKIGGNIDNADYLTEDHDDLDLKALRGRGQLSHAFSGVVGDAGSAGIVGSISVNYRQLNETKVYDAVGLSFRAAGGIDVTDPMAVADITTSDGGTILVLTSGASDDHPRGAIIVRPEGDAGTGPRRPVPHE